MEENQEVEALKLHLGSMKLGNSVDIRLEATELPKVEPYTVVELEEAVYARMCREETSRYWWTESPVRVSVLSPEKERGESHDRP